MPETHGQEKPKKPRYLSGDEIARMFGGLSVLEDENITVKKEEVEKP